MPFLWEAFSLQKRKSEILFEELQGQIFVPGEKIKGMGERKMHPTQLIPTLSIVLNIGSLIWYLCAGEVARASYWGAAAWLTFVVTYLIK